MYVCTVLGTVCGSRYAAKGMCFSCFSPWLQIYRRKPQRGIRACPLSGSGKSGAKAEPTVKSEGGNALAPTKRARVAVKVELDSDEDFAD